MGNQRRLLSVATIFLALLSWGSTLTPAQEARRFFYPEQRRIQIRGPESLPRTHVPDMPPPWTVSNLPPEPVSLPLSLDEAIRIAMENSEVIRVLGGSSGRTIYDPAITNTQVDQARAAFDPSFSVQNGFNREETPFGAVDPLDPTRAIIDGVRTDNYSMSLGLSKPLVSGGTIGMSVNSVPSRTSAAATLNPQTRSSIDLSITQPLLRGFGSAANLAPTVIARIDTERSYYQMKNSVQESVRGVIEAYWTLVAARTDVWVRRQQVEQGEWLYKRAEVALDVGTFNVGPVVQSQSALANFKAGLITAEAGLLQREASLRNILGLPPSDDAWIVPVTPPAAGRLTDEWAEIVDVALQWRPDLVELKLIVEADQQRLLAAHNEALPNVDATALYRWNALSGRELGGGFAGSDPGQFTGWQFGVNVSVPLGMRRARAALRRQELILARDRANLQQGLHDATHRLAAVYRNLSQYYEQYLAFGEARRAARANYEFQAAKWKIPVDGQQVTPYLNVLEAITSWGNATSSEAAALTRYNTELATLEREMGIILETHGVQFAEERFGSIGPLGRMFRDRGYPRDMRPGSNTPRYPTGSQPAENYFHLDNPPSPK